MHMALPLFRLLEDADAFPACTDPQHAAAEATDGHADPDARIGSDVSALSISQPTMAPAPQPMEALMRIRQNLADLSGVC